MTTELTIEQIEHLAVRAVELQDDYTEFACNMALLLPTRKRGEHTYEQVLHSIISEEPCYIEWMEFGANTNYHKRTP